MRVVMTIFFRVAATRAATTATAANTRPITLRGLSPDQTLVLVNGKRRHTNAVLNVNNSIGRGSAGVDLDTIPQNAIQRIEIDWPGGDPQVVERPPVDRIVSIRQGEAARVIPSP